MDSFFVFVFGLIVGSFLNAVVYRIKNGESALKGRSHCPHCGHQLSWQDLIPLVSFVLLQGKCRYCRKPISWQYPAVEILTGSIFLLIFNAKFLMTNQAPNPNVQFFSLLFFWIVASFLIIIFVYDLKYYLIPDIIVYSAVGLAFSYRIFEFLSLNHWDLIRNWSLGIRNFGTLENALVSAILAALFFFGIYFFSKGTWMGFGDVKLAFLMGLFLGFPGILVALYAAFFAGAFAGLALIFAKKKKMNSEVPFGPFLVAGTFVALFWGQAAVDWYLRFLLV